MKKRLLAIILTICLLGTVIIDNVGWMSTVEASDEPTTETGMPASTHTFTDFGVTEGTYKTNDSGNQFDGDITKLLDGGMLTEIIKINKEGTTGSKTYNLVFFSDAASSWSGFKFEILPGRIDINVASALRDAGAGYYQILPTEVGYESFVGTEFELGLAFEKADKDGNGSNDLLVRIYINGKQYTTEKTSNGWIAFEDGVMIVPGGYDKIVNGKDGANQFFNIYPQGGEAVFKETFKTTHTFLDFGITNGQKSSKTEGNKYVGDIRHLLDGGMLSEKLHFTALTDRAPYYMIMFADNGTAWSGIQILVYNTKMQISISSQLRNNKTSNFPKVINASDAGISSFNAQTIEFSMAFEKADTENDGVQDLLIRVYINGNRIIKDTGVYIIPDGYDTITKATDAANQYINLYPEGRYCEMTAADEALYSRETTHTFLDFGATNGMYTANDSGHQFSGDISQLLDGGVLSETIKVNSLDGNYDVVLFSDAADSWAGLKIHITTTDRLQFELSSKLYDTKKEFYLHIDPSEVGLTSFIGTEFELSLAFEKADTDDNGSNDLLIRIYINGKRCKKTDASWTAYQNGIYTIPGGYDKIVEAADAENKYLNIYPQGGKSMIKVASQDVLKAKDYTCYTLKDAGIIDGSGIAYGTLKTDTNSTGTKITGTAYNKVLFGAEVTFTDTDGGARFHYAVPDGSKFDGLQIRYQADGRLIVDDGETSSSQLAYRTMYIEPSQFGYESFLNQSFLLQITTDIVAVNGPETNDVKLGIWIDGQLANNCYCYILDQADTLGCDVNFNEGGAIRYSIWDIKAATGAMVNYVQLKNQASYLVEADRFITKDGNTTYTNGQTVVTVGEYTAHYDATDIAAAATKTVVLWKSYDAHADGEVNVKDLVAVKKYKNDSSALTTKEGQIAAANTKDTETMRKYLLGLVSEVASVSYKTDTDGSKVMPIGSWITPDTFAGVRMDGNNIAVDCIEYGVETNFLQQKYYDMIKDLGINLLTYQRNDYGSHAEKRILKALELAEANNLDAYVHDSGIAYSETDTINLANRLKEYARYSSFKGIHVTDEPSSANISDFNYGLNKTIDEIAAKTKLLNTYSNLTGFVNLFPVCRERFSTYFEEYIEKCEPKELSYDYYPFSSVHGSVKEYFNSLANIRNASMNANIPFTGCIGTTTGSYAQKAVTETNALTEAQMRWNVNTMLAYGAKGITWFTLIEPYEMALKGSDGTTTGMDFTRVGLIGVNGEQNPTTYNAAKNINTWVAHVDGILMDSNSVAVLADGVNYWSLTEYPTWDGNKYKGMTLTASTSGGDSCGAMAGVFDYFGQTVYYVVNNDYTNAQDVTVGFDKASDLTIYRGSNVTSETVTTKTFDLAAGEAVLIIKK